MLVLILPCHHPLPLLAMAQPGGPLTVETSSGKQLPADLVMLVIGVRPETQLAKAAGLELGARGGIKVDAHMRTSDPHIYAVGEFAKGESGSYM